MKKPFLSVSLSVLLLFLANCSGGGGGGSNPPPAQPTTAVLKLQTAGTLAAGTRIGGIQTSVILPSGVSVKSTANPPETDAGVVAASGNASSNSTLLSIYDPASRKVSVFLVNSNGLDTGEYATLNCDIAAGYHPVPQDFSLTGIDVKDLNGASVSGITVELSADIR